MNKIGRRTVQDRIDMTTASNEFLRQMPNGEDYVKASLGRDRIVDGRWLAWRPLGAADVLSSRDSMEAFTRNVTEFQRTQPWEWRFIGRRR